MSYCETGAHVLAPGDIPGWAVKCLVMGCGKMWRRGPRANRPATWGRVNPVPVLPAELPPEKVKIFFLG